MKNESKNFTRKLYLNISMLIILFIITLFRGNGTQPSVVNVKKCIPADYGLLAALIICAVLEAALGSYWIH